jgi:glycosyltransferase involved in cell wall biosynthesis
MRLLLVIPNIVSYGFLREFGAAAIADGDEVHVACSRARILGDAPRASENGIVIHEIAFPRGMNPAAHLRSGRELDRLVMELQPDVIHAHFSAAIFTTALARTARWPRTLATFHGVSFPALSGWKSLVLRVLETWSVRRFDRVWVLTDDDRDRLRASAPGVAIETLASAGVGCDLAKFTPPAPTARAARRAELGFSEQDCVFAFVGRFVAFKGFALTARAFFQLATVESQVRLVLVGDRDGLHPTGLSAAEEEALGESPQVTTTGYCADVQRYLAAADVLVFPSQREGMPVCAMEALALGVPVITSDARGCRDVVRDGVDGLVLREPTVESLCAAMQQLADDSALRARVSTNAFAGRERFDRAHFVREQKRIMHAGAPAEAEVREPAFQP